MANISAEFGTFYRAVNRQTGEDDDAFNAGFRQRDSGHLFHDRLCAIQRCAAWELGDADEIVLSCAGTNPFGT